MKTERIKKIVKGVAIKEMDLEEGGVHYFTYYLVREGKQDEVICRSFQRITALMGDE